MSKKTKASVTTSGVIGCSKRKLKKSEIDDILDFQDPNSNIPKNIDDARIERNFLNLENQLIDIEIYPEIIPDLKEELNRLYRRAKISPGEAVGPLAATYIAEIITQLTLNSFHFSGLSLFQISNAGVPRLMEIMNCSKNIRYLISELKFNTEYIESKLIENQRKKGDKYVKSGEAKASLDELKVMYDFAKSKLEDTLLKHLLKINKNGERKVEFDDIKTHRIKTKKEQELENLFFYFYSSEASESNKEEKTLKINGKFKWSIRLRLDTVELIKKNLSLEIIAEKIEEYRDLYCVFYSDNDAIIDVYVNTDNVEMDDKLLPDESFVRGMVLTQIYETPICGVEGIEMVYFVNLGDKWGVEAMGSNFEALLPFPELDFINLFTNSFWEMYKSLGIEAARSLLIIEIKKIIPACNDCHIKLLADSMTSKGTLTAVSRYGIDKKDTGPLTKASFEETTTTFKIAAVNQEREKLKAPSSKIMMGQLGNFGTGSFDLLFNPKMTEKYAIEEKKEVSIERKTPPLQKVRSEMTRSEATQSVKPRSEATRSEATRSEATQSVTEIKEENISILEALGFSKNVKLVSTIKKKKKKDIDGFSDSEESEKDSRDIFSISPKKKRGHEGKKIMGDVVEKTKVYIQTDYKSFDYQSSIDDIINIDIGKDSRKLDDSQKLGSSMTLDDSRKSKDISIGKPNKFIGKQIALGSGKK